MLREHLWHVTAQLGERRTYDSQLKSYLTTSKVCTSATSVVLQRNEENPNPCAEEEREAQVIISDALPAPLLKGKDSPNPPQRAVACAQEPDSWHYSGQSNHMMILTIVSPKCIKLLNPKAPPAGAVGDSHSSPSSPNVKYDTNIGIPYTVWKGRIYATSTCQPCLSQSQTIIMPWL